MILSHIGRLDITPHCTIFDNLVVAYFLGHPVFRWLYKLPSDSYCDRAVIFLFLSAYWKPFFSCYIKAWSLQQLISGVYLCGRTKTTWQGHLDSTGNRPQISGSAPFEKFPPGAAPGLFRLKIRHRICLALMNTQMSCQQRRTGSSNRPWLSRQTGANHGSSGVTRNSGTRGQPEPFLLI